MRVEQDGGAGAPRGLSRIVTLAMAVACGVVVANIYYNQPLLGILQRSFAAQASIAGFVPTATQLGYTIGIFLLVPLGDKIERRKLILVQLSVLALALAALAAAPSAWPLLAASVAVGIVGTTAQILIPFAAELTPPDRRGATIGMLMSGLLCGILFGRTLSGFVGQHFGWRTMFTLAIALDLAVIAMLAVVLPHGAPRTKLSYPALLGSIFTLIREEPHLRLASAIQCAIFGSFSVFWTTLALRLEQPPYHLGADVAGLFGALGGAGVLAAPLVGRIADQRGPTAAIGIGAALMIAGWLVLGATEALALLVVAVLILDVGVQCCMISNQHIIFALRPEARNRINTVFVCAIFLGGTAGSAGAILCWREAGWPAVCLYGGGLAAIAMAVHLLGRRRATHRMA